MTGTQILVALFNTLALFTVIWLIQAVYSKWRERHPRPVDPYLKTQFDRLFRQLRDPKNVKYLEQWMVEAIQCYWEEVHNDGFLHNRKDPNEEFRRAIFKHPFEPPLEEPATKTFRVEFCKVIRTHRLRLKRKQHQYQSESTFTSKVMSSIQNYQYK